MTASTQLLAPLGFNLSAGRIVPGYPVGLPLLVAAAGRLISLPLAIPAVILAQLLLGVFFTERLAQVCGLARPWSWLAAGMVAICPLYVFMGLQPMSDAPSLVWVTAALYFALSSRDKPSRALWAGAAAALAVLLRPANAICVFPLLLALGASPRRLAGLVLGGLPGALFASWYNFHLYGSPFQTGYGDVRSLFSAVWFGPTCRCYALWITAYFTPVIWLAFLGPLGRPLTRQARISLAAGALIYLGFYAFYCYTHETWWYLRFVLPAFPCLAILSVAGLQRVVDRVRVRTGTRSLVAAGVLASLLIGNAAWQFSRLPILYSGRGNQVYRQSARWIDDHAPANAVILCFQTSGAVSFYTDHPFIRSDANDTPELAAAVRELIRLKIPVYALVFRYDAMPPLDRLAPHWEKKTEIGYAVVWEMIPPA